MEKRYIAMWMWLCEGKLKVKIAHFRLPSASQKRACLSSLILPVLGVIKSLERGELFRRFDLQNRQNAEIDSAGEHLSVESDSQANQRNQTKVLPATTLKRKAASSEQTIVL